MLTLLKTGFILFLSDCFYIFNILFLGGGGFQSLPFQRPDELWCSHRSDPPPLNEGCTSTIISSSVYLLKINRFFYEMKNVHQIMSSFVRPATWNPNIFSLLSDKTKKTKKSSKFSQFKSCFYLKNDWNIPSSTGTRTWSLTGFPPAINSVNVICQTWF